MWCKLFLLSLLAASAVPGALIYRINFTGTITQGGPTARGLDGSPVAVSMVGGTLSGFVEFDFDQRPVGVAVDVGGNPGLNFSSNALSPEWIRQVSVTLDNFPVFVDTLPITATQDFGRAPMPAGGTPLAPATLAQELRNVPALNFLGITRSSRDFWSSPTEGTRDRDLAFIAIFNGVPAFFDANSIQPFPLMSVAGSALFRSSNLLAGEDINAGVFGRTEESFVGVLFRVDTAEGVLVTPEPASLSLVTLALGCLLYRRQQR